MKPLRRTLTAVASIGFLLLLAPLAWSQQTQGVVAVGLKPGQVQIVASYLNANGQLVADTTVLTVMPVAIAKIDLFNQVNPARWISSITIGKQFCPYAVARDTAGNILTGRKVTFTSTDTTVAKITTSSVCPDTTVDMSRLNAVPLPPGPQSFVTLEPIRRPR